VPHLSPTTLTTDEQALILRATAGKLRDHVIFSLALGTGLRLAEIVGLDVGDVFSPERTPCRRSGGGGTEPVSPLSDNDR
jgi:integrase